PHYPEHAPPPEPLSVAPGRLPHVGAAAPPLDERPVQINLVGFDVNGVKALLANARAQGIS
ncbi:hypothetical protein KBZ21_42670, partial [Streptomyces sp. A73]|nr:hypothetical protein [Streptomyces sp. A73]